MAPIRVSARTGPPEDTAADTRVVPLFEGESLSDPDLQALVDLGEAKPALRKVAVTHEDAPGGGRRRVLVAGFGKRAELDAERARVAAAAAAGKARELGAVSLSWETPPPTACPAASWRARSSASIPSTASSRSRATTRPGSSRWS